jgi:tetratricopeptide (TPR) repeat protein
MKIVSCGRGCEGGGHPISRSDVADIFVSYTSSDRLKAFWIGQELMKLGHTPRIHEWEISAGGNIPAWMEKRHHDADHVLLVISKRFLAAPFSNWERQAAQWASADKRPNFALPVLIEDCEVPTLLAHIKRCDLHGLSEVEARAALSAYLAPAAMPSAPVPYFGPTVAVGAGHRDGVRMQAGSYYAVSNIPISVPLHFLGRGEDIVAIDRALEGRQGRAAITTALHGLRGVGKTTLAAAYAEQHRSDYRATWWIRAETIPTIRADLVGLGVRLGWVVADEKEESAVAATLDHLRDEGDGILLVYDNANNADEIGPYTPRGGGAHIIVTSNAPNWRSIAAPVEIEVWPKNVGAAYLIERTGRDDERDAALALSETLGGLPLAHEQAAAYCERLGIGLAEYSRRFIAAPGKFLDDTRAAPAQYHNGLTVAKTFNLAIDEAAKLHPAVDQLIVYAALLSPEPIPLYLFSEARAKFDESFASAIADDGLDEAVAVLLAFALIDREDIPDERDLSITTDCIRLHRLVRQVAEVRCGSVAQAKGALIAALAEVYPVGENTPAAWPRARRLDALAMGLVASEAPLPEGAEIAASYLLNELAVYRRFAIVAYAQARPLAERSLAIIEQALGPDHPSTATALNNLGYQLDLQGDLEGARQHYERALAIWEKALGPDHPDTALSLNNLGFLLRSKGDLAGALPYYERALAIREKALGPDHPYTALSLNNLGNLLRLKGDPAGALPYYERALAIRERVLGPDHPDTAGSLNNLGYLLGAKGDDAGARKCYERALAIHEKVLGPEHPQTAMSLNNLGQLLQESGDLVGARQCYERALAIYEKALGPDHPDTAWSLSNFGGLLESEGDRAGALSHYNRALAIREKALGPDHPETKIFAERIAMLFEEVKLPSEANALRQKFHL